MKLIVYLFAFLAVFARADPADVCEKIEGAFRNATEQGETVSCNDI